MKLLSYHVENYGKVHCQDGVFSEDITCLCEKNGFGKSTLASFIKAMFYGLDSYTVSSKGFNDRQRYYPFEGGKFGGNLTFEYAGKVYRIERFFDKKSGKGDECKVFENGEPFDGFGEEIGKTLFGLDEDSFKRTVFITADEIEVSSTHSINEKLNRTVEGVGDGYEQAIDALEKAKKSFKAARGNNDKISEKKREISELTAQIKNLQDMSRQLDVEYSEREQLCGKIDELEQAFKEGTERNLVLQKWETFEAMLQQKEKKETILRALREKYPRGIPEEEDCISLRGQWENINRLRGSIQAMRFPLQKQTELEKLEEKFKNGVPMVASIDEAQQNIHRLTVLEGELLRAENTEESAQEKQLVKKFSLSMPTKDEWEKNRTTAEEYKRKEREFKERSAMFLQNKEEKMRPKFKKEWYFLILAFALLCSGIGVYFVAKTTGIGLCIAGGIFLVTAGVIRMMNPDMPRLNDNLSLSSLQAEIKVLEEKLRSVLVPYGYYSEAGVLFDFVKMEEDLTAYETLLLVKEQRNGAVFDLKHSIHSLQEEVKSFLAIYGENGDDLQAGLRRLTAGYDSYRALQADKEESVARERQARESLSQAEQGISAILQKYALAESVATMDGLNALSADINTAISLKEELKDLEKNLFDYREKNQLTERPQTEPQDTDELRAQLSKHRKALADCDKRIAETERFIEKTADAENALLLAEEQLKEYKEKYELIIDTITALKGAEQRLKDKYIAPIKERFSVYAKLLEEVLNEKISMDKDFRIVFERGGEARSDKHLSAGEKSLCTLCLRLALIDNMYENEQPFLIMDDPFVHLDEQHLARTKSLIRALGQGRQIVYFCCHESRKV